MDELRLKIKNEHYGTELLYIECNRIKNSYIILKFQISK